jgi:very-short-patch-repair endonuclease
MAQFDAQSGRIAGSTGTDDLRGSIVSLADSSRGQSLPRGLVAEFILGTPPGSVLALEGIEENDLRGLLDQIEPQQAIRRALFVRIAPALTADAIVERVLDLLAATTLRLWPLWFTDVSFHGCRNDTLGRLAMSVTARRAAAEIAGLSQTWAEAAGRLALDGRSPRVSGTLPAIELAQLARAVSRSGLVLVVDVGIAARIGPNPAALVHAVEWIAQHSGGTVVALFAQLPSNEPPFDRILYGARSVTAEVDAALRMDRAEAAGTEDTGTEDSGTEDSRAEHLGPWIAPWRGLPHPLSVIERRLAKALEADTELSPLFHFNKSIDTLRGSRPKVDLVWAAGRLVVELDGYESHGNRSAFMYDRHRDYELALSGYTVLRLANDEIAQDIEKAIEKIRDLVKLCRARTMLEG